MALGRKSWPIDQWPRVDQEAWALATEPATMFSLHGGGAHWKPKTKRTVRRAYGRWLAYLDRQSCLDEHTYPAARITKDRLKAYWRELCQEVAPVTSAGLITNLSEAARVMSPDSDFTWLKTIARKLVANAKPSRDKGMKTLPLDRLLALGAELMNRAEVYSGKVGPKCAARFRLGLMIVLLAATGLRRSNFTELELRENLTRQDDRYRISLSGRETKGKRAHSILLAAELTPLIERYLDYWRPMLLSNRISNRLWITWLGDDLTEGGFYGELGKTSKRELGVQISPHAFRDSIATSVALHDPAHVRMLKAILQHQSLKTTDRHYNLAKQSSAVDKHQDTVRKIRQAARKHSYEGSTA